ncbi:MAG TPA: ribonuclease domain-containing protein [Propionibacteriaceae bacterium]|nr:ribonuclease domain-containing protein [Propionibacteriaceae bacterium]
MTRILRGLTTLIMVLALVVGAWWVLTGSDGGGFQAGQTGQPSTSRAATTKSATSKPVSNKPSVDRDSGLPMVALTDLPKQARQTVALIEAGGPFPYPDKDGDTYFNFNEVLPKKSKGYYREYTVTTPGESSRGARRIVAGKPGEFYYTADHYDSFVRIG